MKYVYIIYGEPEEKKPLGVFDYYIKALEAAKRLSIARITIYNIVEYEVNQSTVNTKTSNYTNGKSNSFNWYEIEDDFIAFGINDLDLE